MSAGDPYIKALFNPKNVVVIGASSNPEKLGYSVLNNILSNKYTGKVYPVNPKGEEILGLKSYKIISDVPEKEIDVVIMVIPAKHVLTAVKECTTKKVKNLVIISSGFSEIGNSEEEHKIVELAKKHNMRILGPNIFGIYSASVSLNATFGPKDITPGNVAILTQSGAIGIGMIGKTALANLGLSSIISIGNKCDINETDLIEYLIDDENTKIIMMYMEGVKDGQAFIATLKKAAHKKPVIVIKSGRSARGAMATASHTGSLAGEDNVFDDIMKQCAVLRAESLQEGLNWAKFLSNSPMPKGKNTVIITNGGGLGVLATDACEKYNISLYDDQKRLEKIYKDSVISFGSTKNPIDLTGGATAKDYDNSISDSLKDKEIHSIIGLYCETSAFDGNELPNVIKAKQIEAVKAGKPVVFSLFGGNVVESATHILNKENVPSYSDVYDAISCLGALYRYTNSVENLKNEKIEKVSIDINEINKIVGKVKKEGRNFLLADEAQAVMRAAKITVPQSSIAKTEKEAIALADKIGYPVVMKIVSKDIIHKSEAGGVVINLQDKEQVKEAYSKILTNARKYNSKAVIDGVEVTQMVKKGLETIIGARKDASFGPIVMFGLGGIYVEVLKDVVFRAVPLGKNEAKSMVQSIKAAALLTGVRGEAAKDLNGIIDTILKIGEIIKSCPLISDIEINPLTVYEKNVMCVDIRILLN